MSEPKNVGHTLYRETEAAKTLRAQLADILGGDEDLAVSMVEGETDLNEAIDLAVAELAHSMAHIKGLNEYIDTFQKRKERLQHRMENLRTMLSVAMEQAGRTKIEQPAVTLSLRAVPPSVTVTSEADIPSAYWTSQPPKLDKRTLLADLKDKKPVPGAELSNGGTSLALKWS
jgi:hypothetical protein